MEAQLETDALRAFTNYQEVKEETIKRSALNRMGTPDDIAGAVYFLCSDEAGWITGQTLIVDGGTTFKVMYSNKNLNVPNILALSVCF